MQNAVVAPTFLGHPRGLLTLALAEGCERFSYYGMPLIGGLMADRVLGRTRAITVGALCAMLLR